MDEKGIFKMIQNDRDLNDQSDGSATSLMEYAYLLWRWAWLIALAAVLAGGAAYFISKRTTPVYQTTTRLLFSNPPSQSSIDTTSIISGATMTQTYSQMLTDTPVLDKVIEKLHLNMSSKNLVKAISVKLVLNTQIISVDVEDTSPSRAVEIANALGQVFADRILQLQSERYGATLEGLQKQVDDMGKQIEATNTQLSQELEPAQKLQLDTRLTEYRQLYSNLVMNYEQVRLAEAQTSTNVAVAQPAQLPTDPVRPKTMQNTLLAAMMAILLAGGVVFAIDFLDDTIKNPDEIRQKFGLPILGVIAQHTQVAGRPITQDQPRSPVSESFRTLRTNITYAVVDTPLRWIMVTSPTPMDGKTTVCANLGVVFAQGGKKAVVVDGDLRRPMEHSRFGLANTSGLSDLFLRPRYPLNGPAQATGVPGLKVVTSGTLPPNPAELMASKKMIEILERLTAENDLVLVDTPPVLSVTDAAALAPGVDGVILVAKPGVTKLAAFKQTLEQLQGVGAKILGVVLNDVEPKSRKYGYYYHQYYSKYSYYYSADGTKKKKSRKEPTKETELKQV
jgi:succinoglycan biosynthesis transport protein ExoP